MQTLDFVVVELRVCQDDTVGVETSAASVVGDGAVIEDVFPSLENDTAVSGAGEEGIVGVDSGAMRFQSALVYVVNLRVGDDETNCFSVDISRVNLDAEISVFDERMVNDVARTATRQFDTAPLVAQLVVGGALGDVVRSVASEGDGSGERTVADERSVDEHGGVVVKIESCTFLDGQSGGRVYSERAVDEIGFVVRPNSIG